MAELVYQTWERITGKPWSAAAAGGYTTGSYSDNVALQKKLLGGWNPYTAAPKPKAAPAPKPAPAPAPKASSPGPVPVDPGLLAQQWEAMLSLEKYIIDLQAQIAKLDRAQVLKIANLQAEIDRATLAQNQLQFESSLAFDVERLDLSKEEFDARVDQFRQQFDLSVEQFDFQKESFAQEFGERARQFDTEFGLRERAFEFEQDKFAQQFGLSRDEFEEFKNQFQQTLGFQQEQAALEEARFQQQFGLSVSEFEEVQRQFDVSSDLEQERFLAELGFSREQFEQAQAEFSRVQGFAESRFAQEFGLSREQFEQGQFEFGETFGLERERFGLERTLAEAQLAANPSNFVALQLYKRSLQEQGIEAPAGQGAIGDTGIQDLFSFVLGLEGGDTQGTGQFGVEIPTPGAISRQQAGQFTTSDIELLSSFLQGGIDVGEGEFAGINPADFFQEVEQGFIPTVEDVPTQYQF